MKTWRLLPVLLTALAVVAALLWRGQSESDGVLLRDAGARVAAADASDAAPGAGATLMVSVTMENAGAPDRLISAGSSVAAMAKLRPAPGPNGLPIPAGSSPSLAPEGAHLLLFGVDGALKDGRLVPFTLTFANAGEIGGKAPLRVVEGAEGEINKTAAGDAMAHVPSDAPPPAGPSPALSLNVEPDGDGWRITADAGDFRFAPAAMDEAHAEGEGHGHLYVDGLKIMRMTGPEVSIGALPKGRHEVSVVLNANDHRPYVSGGKPVGAAVMIDVE